MSSRCAPSWPYRRGASPWWALLVVLGLLGCRRPAEIAKLTQKSGTVDRDHATAVGSWETAPVPATFALGDGVRTFAASRAELRLFDDSTLALEPKTLLRFLPRPSGRKGAKLDLELGAATLEAGGEALSIEMQLGGAEIASHGKVRLVRAADSTRVEVLIGSARILTEKETLELTVGEAVEILDDRSVRRAPAASAVPVPSATPAASLPPTASAEALAATSVEHSAGGVAVARGPSVVDLVAAAGDSFVVHDPRPPTAIAFVVGRKCATGALLTLDPGRGKPRETVGESQVSMELPTGTHRYAIACREATGAARERVAEGTISVLADAGSRQLAKSPPLTTVETDGRHYTVLYQSLLPRITVEWPNPPPAGSYTLTVHSGSGSTRSFPSSGARHSFAAGGLGEGDHTLTFESDGHRSRPTTLSIHFDNAAPTASIASPADGSFAPGTSVLVSGAALPGFTVSAGGQELGQDAQNRFSQTVTTPTQQRALVIRFSQAGRGVHYYLRRSAR